eukprot:tig00000655_g2876.t1
MGKPAIEVTEAQRLRAAFEKAGQGHVFAHVDQLSAEDASALYAQAAVIESTGELEDIARSVEEYRSSAAAPTGQLQGIQPFSDLTVLRNVEPATRARWLVQGLKLLREGKAAALVLAGGQGSRLGYDGPKGTMPLGLQSGKSLFQIQAERLLRLQALAASNGSQAAPIMWYIMCSDNQAVTERFFEEHAFFGLRRDQVFFFAQTEVPCISFDGKILMHSKSKISTSPNGNGGIYGSLLHSKALADMKKRGIDLVHVFCVDNILCSVADPIFLGFCWERRVEAAAKVVEKKVPEEPCGVLALDSARRTRVLEYSEIPGELAAARDAKTGALVYNAANVCIHAFTVEFLEQVANNKLPYHFAKSPPRPAALKKIPCVEEPKPSAVNGLKREMFIFDAFMASKSFAAMQVEKEDEFSPVKNATGPDSPATAVAALSEQQRRALVELGARVEVDEADPRVEVSPLLYYGLRGHPADEEALLDRIAAAGPAPFRTPVHIA